MENKKRDLMGLAKKLGEDWFSVCYRTNHANWREKNNLPRGERDPLGSSTQLDIARAVSILPKLKKYLEETPIHEFSGAIYGDYKMVQGQIWRQKKEYEKISVIGRGNLVEEGKRIILSEARIFFYRNQYMVVSDSSYYTGCIPSYNYRIIFRSKRPIELKIIRRGDVSCHTLGYIRYLPELQGDTRQ